MGIHSKRQYLQTIRHRYKYATRDQKTHILDEFRSVCSYNRKYAIWLLNATGKRKSKIKKVHDKPKTPFQRLMESENINNQTKERLKQYLRTLNPFDLHQQMIVKIKPILKVVLGENV